jgi:8-oxo-dGTP pyrophosphatase MutT (NUDIX family)
MKRSNESLERQQHEDEAPIVAVGGVIYRQGVGQPELLLIRKRHGFWTLPKGQVKRGESEYDALVREVREETGISGDIEAPVQQVTYTVQKAGRLRRKIVTYYAVRAGEGAIRPGVGEGIEFVRWFPFRAALRRIRRKRIRAVARAARPLLERPSAKEFIKE